MVMRWLTRAWATGGVDVQAWQAALDACLEHEASLTLPESVDRLRNLSVHDAQPLGWTLDAGGGTAVLELCTGDLQRGYSRTTIRYGEAVLVGATPTDVETWLRADSTELLYDELDRSGDRFVQRLLLVPDGEFAVEFTDVAITAQPDACRRPLRPS